MQLVMDIMNPGFSGLVGSSQIIKIDKLVESFTSCRIVTESVKCS